MSVPFGRPVYVVGAAALSPLGAGWRGLAARVARGTPSAGAVPPLAADVEPCEPRHRKMMSRAAYLAAAAVAAALREPGVTGAARAETACFLGVGASGGDLGELEAMLRESVVGGALDLARFGDAGLRAANPLFAFQLMNNFTLCHAAILAGLEGPNAAFHSRGAGTVTALREAAFAVAEGEAPLALAGGADSALHPVTALELARAPEGPRRRPPAEGAALLALAARPAGEAAVRLVRADVTARADEAAARAAAWEEPARRDEPRVLVVTASSPRVGDVIARAAAWTGTAELLSVDDALGETLAAAPALAWAVALDWLGPRARGRARVLSAGLDGALGVVELAKEAP